MSVVRDLCDRVRGDPVFMRRVQGWLTVAWLAMIPLVIFAGWYRSIPFLVAISLWANLSGHWSAWQSARVEVRQEEDADVQEVLDEIRDDSG